MRPNEAKRTIHTPEGVRFTKNVFKSAHYNLRPDQLANTTNWLALYRQEVKWGRG